MRPCSSSMIHHQMVGVLTRSGSQHACQTGGGAITFTNCSTDGIDGKPFACTHDRPSFYILLAWMLQEEPGEKSERKRSRRARKRGPASEVVLEFPFRDRVKTNTTQQHRCGAINSSRLSFRDVRDSESPLPAFYNFIHSEKFDLAPRLRKYHHA